MLIKLVNAAIYDPVYCKNGVIEDIFIQNGRIIAPPNTHSRIDKVYDLNGKVVMAGAIDLHSHIGGGQVNIARMMLPESHFSKNISPHLLSTYLFSQTKKNTCFPLTKSGWGAFLSCDIGHRYAEMGYTAAFEPAVLPINARQAHLEMQDIPIIDKGGYVVLGNDDFFLRLLASGASQRAINDYVAWMLRATQCIGIKVINPGGINAFKFNQRQLNLDEPNSHYGLTPRQILKTLALAVRQIGIPHPLHVHGCNLGVPGNIETTLNTIAGIEGLPMHLTHIQFHSYGKEGDRHFSSGAARLAEAINKNINITVDVGQIRFGQTVILTDNAINPYRSRYSPMLKKWIWMDVECEGGCGAVPFHYKDKDFVHALQWAIGLEILLLVNDPWRVFLTTDHPNGGPFTYYPHVIRLLMDKSFRNDRLATIHPEAAAMSTLGSITREYSLYDIAILTRAGVAQILGLHDRGHLGEGAVADIVVYTEQADKEKMFARPTYVFKDGELVVQEGKVVKTCQGGTHIVRPEFSATQIERELKDYFTRFHTVSLENFKISDEELIDNGKQTLLLHPCKRML